MLPADYYNVATFVCLGTQPAPWETSKMIFMQDGMPYNMPGIPAGTTGAGHGTFQPQDYLLQLGNCRPVLCAL